MKFRVLNMKHLDALVVEVEELQIIELLLHEMTRVEEQVTPGMAFDAVEKHFE
jgi:hypothetical protein